MKLVAVLLVALAVLGWIFVQILGRVPNPAPSAMSSSDFWWLVLIAIVVAGGLVWRRIRSGRWLRP
jgi:Na+-driven multidrug efflux pump